MSLLQETIVYILLIPFLLQLVLPLAMLLVYLVSLPVRTLFFTKRTRAHLGSDKFSSVEHPA